MTIKERVASLLEEKEGEFISGEEMAQTLGISRAAVWKAIKSLKEYGFVIEAATNKGYRLSDENDILSATGIGKYLGELGKKLEIRVLETVVSTNTLLKELAAAGAQEGTVIVASEQTGGRGRFSRRFFSPSGSGIYLSVLIRPDMPAADATLITTAAAVAVSDALESVSGRKTGIKWVNDLLIDSKKVCGILTEASLNIESGNLDYAVVGIGLNAYEPPEGFPEEIKDIAGAIFTEKCGGQRNKLTAEVLKSFFNYYGSLKDKRFIDSYRKRCIVLGKQINVIKGDRIIPATATDIDDECRLLVKYENGSQELLGSGEISIKL